MYFQKFVFVFFVSFSGYAQSGCTDLEATNYNLNATLNDGSCVYTVFNATSTLKCKLSSNILESSGLAYSDGKLWTINDSGNSASFFSVDTTNGTIIQTVIIDNYPNVDWEEIKADADYIYIGDFGNNNGTRTDLKVLKVAKSDIGTAATVHLNASAITFSYSDQTSFKSSTTHNFDCEAMISIGNFLYLFTKNRGDKQSRVYKLSKTPGIYSLSPFTFFNTNGLVTGADYDPVKNEVSLVGYASTSHIYSFVWILNDFQNDMFFSGNKRRIELGANTDWQTEGICYQQTQKLFISAEGSTLYTLSESQWLKPITTGLYKAKASEGFFYYPNPSNDKVYFVNSEPIISVTVEDLYGKNLFTDNVEATSYTMSLDRFSFTSGMHLVKIHTAIRTLTTQVLFLKH